MRRSVVPRRKRLGEILVRQGKISPEQLGEFLRIQKESSEPLGQILKNQGILTEEDLTRILGEQLGIPHVWLRKGLVDPHIVHLLPREKAQLYQVIPMFRVNNTLSLATADPNAIFVFDEVAKSTGLQVQPVLCRADDIIEAINESYREDVSIDEVMASIDESSIELVESGKEREVNEIAEMAEGSPVINLTNMILLRAIRDGASDIHLEPRSDRFQIRARIDGVLYDLIVPKLEMHPAVVSRLKVMANLDIAERRLPQDGRIQVNVDRRTVDLRFSSMPGIRGEKVVLRILDKSRTILNINKLGFEASILEPFKTALRRHVEEREGPLTTDQVGDIAASFQEAVVDVLVLKTLAAARTHGTRDLVVAGGVAANRRLRARMTQAADKEGLALHLVPVSLCTDNGAMVAALGYHYLFGTLREADAPRGLDMDPFVRHVKDGW